jgi:hypothetical protein
LMHFYFGYSEDYEVVDFYSDEQSQNQYWNSLISRDHLFTTSGQVNKL